LDKKFPFINQIPLEPQADFPSFSIDRYRILVEEAQDIIYEIDGTGYFTFVNGMASQILGYTRAELLSMYYLDLIEESYRENVALFYSYQIESGEQSSYMEFPVVAKGGKVEWIGQKVQLVYRKDVLMGAIAVARISTDRHNLENGLKLSEEKYRGILENLQFGLMEVDLGERIVFVNDTMTRITGFSREELMGHVASDLLVRAETKEKIEEQHLLREKNKASAYEVEIIRKDGSSFFGLISGAPTFDLTGKRTGSIGVHVDITERKKGELELREIKQKLDEYTKGLENLNTIISDNYLTTDQQLEFGLKIVSDYFGYPMGGIVKAEGDNLRVIQTIKSFENSPVTNEHFHSLPIKGSVAGISYLRNELIAVPDISLSEYEDFEIIQKMKIKSMLTMPIQVENRVYGSILLGGFTPRKEAFSNYDIEFFKLFSRFVGYLISTQKLEKTIERYNSGLVRLNEVSSNSKLNIEEQLKEGLKVITEYLNFKKGGVLLASGDDLTIISTVLDQPLPEGLGQKIPIKGSPAGISFSENRLIAIPDVSKSEFCNSPFMEAFGLSSCIFIPLEIEGIPAGVIALGDGKIKEDYFTQNDLEFLRLFSLRVGYLISNQQNQESLKKERENLHSINEELDKNQKFLSGINQFVTSLLDKEDIYSISWEITENIIEKFGFTDCVIYVLNEDSGHLEQIAAYGLNKTKSRQILHPIQIPFGSGIVGTVAQTGKAEIIPDTRKDPRYITDDEVRLSEISIPIIADGKVIGVIDSEHEELDFFTQDHFKTLTTIANLVANRLKNAKSKRRQEKAEEELRESENKLRTVINSALDAIITVDDLGQITEWNPQAAQIFGWTKEEVLGHLLTENIIPTQHRTAHFEGMNNYMATGHVPALNQRIEITALHKSGREFPIELSIIPMVNNGEHSFTAFARDITLQKNSKDEMERALAKERELSELKSRFVSMTSHEFRTPLTTIKQNVDLIDYALELKNPELKPAFSSYFKRISSEIIRVTSLMNDMLLLGRIEAGKVEITKKPVDLVKFSEQTIQRITLGREDRRTIQLQVVGVKRPVPADANLLEHILGNLFTNALKYSEGKPNPLVTISFELLSQVRISVKDFGIGIPLKDQKGLFASFYRATNVKNIQGTGLGLSIVKEFIDMHGGTISVISDTNQGSEFILVLPMA